MAQQLLRFRLYPATAQNPNTAATFRTLHHFQLLSFESKCSIYEFHQTLVRKSDNTSCQKVKVCVNQSYFRSIASIADEIWRIAIRLFSKWFDNGGTSKCLNGPAMGIFIMRKRKSDTHALSFVLPARSLESTFRWTGSKHQRKRGSFVVYHEQNTNALNLSQSTVGSIRSSLLLMGTLEWVERVCHQRSEIPAWLRDVAILLMMTN